MLDKLTKLYNSTILGEQPEHIGRIHIECEDGTTAHGVVGGESKVEIESKTLEMLENGERLLKVEKFSEGDISHPLR